MGIKPVVSGGKRFTITTTIRNLTRLDAATLLVINVVIVNFSDVAIGVLSSNKLKRRVDSFVG